MEPKFNSSFIPKKTLAQTQVSKPKRRGGQNLLLFVGVVLLFISILAAVGVFLYGEYLKISIEQKEEQLDRARGAFEPALIQELTRLDERINTSQQILSQHIAPSLFFDFLEENTLTNVRFGQVIITPTNADEFGLVMSGEANSFSAIALQSDLFKDSDMLREPIVFSGFTLDEFGKVSFNVSAAINANALLYKRVLEQPIQ